MIADVNLVTKPKAHQKAHSRSTHHPSGQDDLCLAPPSSSGSPSPLSCLSVPPSCQSGRLDEARETCLVKAMRSLPSLVGTEHASEADLPAASCVQPLEVSYFTTQGGKHIAEMNGSQPQEEEVAFERRSQCEDSHGATASSDVARDSQGLHLLPSCDRLSWSESLLLCNRHSQQLTRSPSIPCKRFRQSDEVGSRCPSDPSTSCAADCSRTADSLLHHHRPLDDLMICGVCRSLFTSLDVFVSHKRSNDCKLTVCRCHQRCCGD